MNQFYTGKKVLVTGVCGTVGQELVKLLVEEYQVEELTGIDNNETELFFMKERFNGDSNIQFYLADIRDRDKLCRILKNIDIVFHAAALKHLILCEHSPFEAVQTNIIGVQNIIISAMENKVEKVVFTSSDKAVNPTNVMGTSKLMGERLMTAANNNLNGEGPIFISTRFGNVLGSRGSVLPVFREQIRNGGPVTLTSLAMTRFIMSIEEAVQLVVDSVCHAFGGEVFIPKMPIIRIKDLAEAMITELAPHYGYSPDDISIEIIGVKPGEKMYEELMNIEETRRALELKRYFVILPAFRSIYQNIQYEYDNIVSDIVSKPYQSDKGTPLTKKQLTAFLNNNNLLFDPSV